MVNDLLTMSHLATSYDPAQQPDVPAGVYTITATFDNTSMSSIRSAVFEVTTLTGGNLVLNADGGPAGEGAIVSVPGDALGADGVLTPGESFTVDFDIGLQQRRRFTFYVDALGVDE